MPKSLSCHRNTIERRVKKQVRSDMMDCARAHGSQDVVAYAIVSIRADGTSHASWDTGSALPIWAFAPTIFEALKRDVEESGAEETWTPSLQERKRPLA